MISIDWNNRHVRIADGRIGRESFTLDRAAAFPWPEDLDRADPQAVGNFLRYCAGQTGVRGRSVVTCIDRRNLVVKAVPLGGIDEDEIPEVVRLQALRDLTLPLEETTIDYLKLDAASDGEEPLAVIAVAQNDVIAFAKNAFQAAGLKLAGLWPGPLAQVRTAAVLLGGAGGPLTTTDHHALLALDGDVLELSILFGHRFLTSASRPVQKGASESGDAASLISSVRRLVASLATKYDAGQVAVVAAAGLPNVPEVSDELAAIFGKPVTTLDPLQGLANCTIPLDQRGGFTQTVGSLLLSNQSARRRINFLAPKRVTPKPDRKRIAAILGAGLILLGGQQAYRHYSAETNRLAAGTKRAVDQEKKSAKELASLREVERQTEFIEAWQEQDVVWLDVLRDWFATMPEASRVFVSSATLSRIEGSNPPKSRIRIEGFAASQSAISEMNRRLNLQPGFEVRPGPVQPSTSIAGYPWQFSAELSRVRSNAAR